MTIACLVLLTSHRLPLCFVVWIRLPYCVLPRPEQCKGFFCFFTHQGKGFDSEEKKCAFLMTLLTGKAIDWVAVVWETDPLFQKSYSDFVLQLKAMFEYSAGHGCFDTTFATEPSQPYGHGIRHRIQNACCSKRLQWYCTFGCISVEFKYGVTGITCVQGTRQTISEYVMQAIQIDNLMSNN